MFTQGTLKDAGIGEENLQAFFRDMRRQEFNFHSVLMLRGNKIFFEKYWAPFEKDTPHRMYSVTKSFVSAAIGLLIDDGKLSLKDPIIKYFPDKLPEHVPPLLARQTVEDMLTMRTCFVGIDWFKPEVKDRTAYYFSHTPVKVPGTLFDYDSTGSYVLGVLAERVSGKPLLTFLRERILDHLGGFENAEILSTMDGTPWGDSALICTPRALLGFAKFVMDGGAWEGKQLLSRSYLEAATGVRTPNVLSGGAGYNLYGYGYQIWRGERDSFSFHGMGAQFAICVPDKDFIFVCTADDQLTSQMDTPELFRAVFDHLVYPMEPADIREKIDLDAPASIKTAQGGDFSPLAQQISDVVYRCEPNSMGIRRFSLHFEEKHGIFRWENDQGPKELRFGIKENEIGSFPQLGYSDGQGNTHEINGFMYRCAASAGWLSDWQLQLRVQIIDRYFGMLIVTFGYTEDGLVTVRMSKCAEDFLREYEGLMIASPEK